MKTLTHLFLLTILGLTLAGCGETDDGHSHAGSEGEAHAHEDEGQDHAGENDHGHDHEEPGTEAFYGDEADRTAPESPEETTETTTDAGNGSHHHEDGEDDHHH